MIAVRRAVMAALLVCGVLASPAGAATRTTTRTTTSPVASQFFITGAGFGHGVGMSQYGAAGFALHGYTYERILAHYYLGTTLGKVEANRTVTVLLHEGAATFRGATAIVGYPKKLNSALNYGVFRDGSRLRVMVGRRTVGTFATPLIVHDKGGLHGTGAPLTLDGQGTYDGVFLFRPNGDHGVMTIDSVGVDDYVRGVVTSEMPSSWPAQALEAQAVAARTYAVSAPAATADFDVYDDTRSQVYRGVSGQTATGDAAVAATSGKVVEYYGHPVVTYFFSSSGGHTESIQNVWYDLAPAPWLRGVPDPYDDSYDNPYHHWTILYTLASAEQRVGGFYKGKFEGIKVTQTGVSPRVVHALVVGSEGAGDVTGIQLQRLFRTRSTDMSFTTLTEQGARTRTVVVKTTESTVRSTRPSVTLTDTPASVPPTTTDTTNFALTATPATTTPVATTARSLSRGSVKPASKVVTKRTVTIRLSLQGTVYPVKRGETVRAELDRAGAWRSVARAHLTARGTYAIPVKAPGAYRVVCHGLEGPEVRVP